MRLAALLADADLADPVVLGLPRGGVPVAFMVARALQADVDVIIVRKLGAPRQRELAMGAVGEGGIVVVDPDVARRAGASSQDLARVEADERRHVLEQAATLRGGRECVSLSGRTVVIVDDGVATGSTMLAACQVVRAHGPARVVVAVPVSPRSTLERLRRVADDVICAETPHPFMAVGQWYHDFDQVSDAEVVTLLRRAATERDSATHLDIGPVVLGARLTVPADADGLVLFAHGSGSSRRSPRNLYVAEMLNRSGLATCLLDLLVDSESDDRGRLFDVDLLGGRLTEATAALVRDKRELPPAIGYFGASTGAAAALTAAARLPDLVRAVVSRGGRPDLAADVLPQVRCPTLLVVGGRDEAVLALNRSAAAMMTCPVELEVVHRATHLFEESGALSRVATLACDWFTRHLPDSSDPGRGKPR